MNILDIPRSAVLLLQQGNCDALCGEKVHFHHRFSANKIQIILKHAVIGNKQQVEHAKGKTMKRAVTDYTNKKRRAEKNVTFSLLNQRMIDMPHRGLYVRDSQRYIVETHCTLLNDKHGKLLNAAAH